MEYKSLLSSDRTEPVFFLVKTFVRTWNDKNIETFGECFTDNAEFTDVVGQTAIGREAIKEQHVFPFEVVMKKAILEINNMYLREISEDFVIISAKWKNEGSMTRVGEKLTTRNGIIQIVCNNINDKWKIMLVHNSDNSLPYKRQEKFL